MQIEQQVVVFRIDDHREETYLKCLFKKHNIGFEQIMKTISRKLISISYNNFKRIEKELKDE